MTHRVKGVLWHLGYKCVMFACYGKLSKCKGEGRGDCVLRRDAVSLRCVVFLRVVLLQRVPAVFL